MVTTVLVSLTQDGFYASRCSTTLLTRRISDTAEDLSERLVEKMRNNLSAIQIDGVAELEMIIQ
jgi:hypothetical protein